MTVWACRATGLALVAAGCYAALTGRVVLAVLAALVGLALVGLGWERA